MFSRPLSRSTTTGRLLMHSQLAGWICVPPASGSRRRLRPRPPMGRHSIRICFARTQTLVETKAAAMREEEIAKLNSII